MPVKTGIQRFLKFPVSGGACRDDTAIINGLLKQDLPMPNHSMGTEVRAVLATKATGAIV
jgi:hypothetical protein